MSPIQTNTQRGSLVFVANAAIADGRLVKLIDATGAAVIGYPTADGQLCQFVTISSTSASGENIEVMPLSPEQNVRLVSTGTIAGAVAIMAENATGKVKAATGAGVFVLGITEQDSIINQHVAVRPVVYRLADA